MTTPFDPTALWSKSKIFIERGIAARDAGDPSTFHTWAALALELLGKAALATVHPVLVADPTKVGSLLVACGRPVTDATRSIAAKTTYERLASVFREYDHRANRFCLLMANRRNEELHTGSSPTIDLDQRAWIPQFWTIADLLSGLTGRSLDDWVGADDAARAREVIADSSRTRATAVEARIARCRKEFDERYPPESDERRALLEFIEQTYTPAAHRNTYLESDSHCRVLCPACTAKGWLFGYEAESHRLPIEYDEMGVWQFENVVFTSESFNCNGCGLVLHGNDEISDGDLPTEFEDTREVEPDYEPDYGND